MVNEAKTRIKEITLEEARARLAQNPQAVLLDVREENEWEKGHAIQAVHLGKGVLERDIEKMFPDPSTELIMYCGGGYRSALTADGRLQGPGAGRLANGEIIKPVPRKSGRGGEN